jgi:hypothetical protein
MAEAYERLGRKDLGGLVREGKKYQRLNRVVEGPVADVGELIGFRKVFRPELVATDNPPTNMLE